MARRNRTPRAWRIERQLIRYVYESPDITRQDLAVRLGQNSAAVSLVIRRLINSGWLRESGRAVSLGGRRPVQLRLSAHKALIAGQTIAADGIRSVLANPDGDVLAQTFDEGQPTADELPGRIGRGFDSVIRQAKVGDEQIVGAGLALSGLVRDAGSTRDLGGTATIGDASCLELLRGRFGDRIVAVDHFARARLVWEMHRNASLRDEAVLLLDLGKEMSCALSVQGTCYRGWEGTTVEIGDLPVGTCGRGAPRDSTVREAIGLGPVLARTRAAVAGTRSSLLMDMLDGDPERLSALAVARAAQAGDAVAFRVVNDVGEAVGQAVTLLAGLLRPRTVVLAGELVTSGLLSLDTVRRTVRLLSAPEVNENLHIVVSEAEEWGAAQGVAHLVLRMWLDSLVPLDEDQPGKSAG